jgi:hypothetical protein
MGSLSSVVTPLASVGAKAIGTIGSQIISNQGRRQEQRELDRRNQQIADNAALQKQQNLLLYTQRENDRTARVRRSIASQRAKFGSQGVGSVTGSSETVLEGIENSSSLEGQDNRDRLSLDNSLIDNNATYQRDLNLLQKQQLRQKSNLSFLSSF